MAKAVSGDLADARLDVRFAGYCVDCDRIVERADDGSCPHGHPVTSVAGKIVLVEGDEVPRLPRFNLAAFLIPFIWGPAHEQWVGAAFLPIWLFLDTIVGTASKGGVPGTVAAVFVVVATFGFQAFFAKRANGVSYRQVIAHTSVAEFARKERIWAIASIPAAALLIGWIVWFHVVVAPTISTR